MASMFMLLALLVGGWVRFARRAEPLPVFGSPPAWTLTDHLKRSVSSDALRGKVVVANFVYTACTDICPSLSGQMLALQKRLQQDELLGQQVHLLSFTVDPARDTPEVLRAYADRFAADPAAWWFVTGPEAVVKPLIVDGFKLGVQALPPTHTAHQHASTAAAYEVMHSGRFVLIDPTGAIRAYYAGDAFDLHQVVQDIHQVLGESGRRSSVWPSWRGALAMGHRNQGRPAIARWS